MHRYSTRVSSYVSWYEMCGSYKHKKTAEKTVFKNSEKICLKKISTTKKSDSAQYLELGARHTARARTGAGAAVLVLVLHQMRVPLIDLLRLATHGVGLLGAVHVHRLGQVGRQDRAWVWREQQTTEVK